MISDLDEWMVQSGCHRLQTAHDLYCLDTPVRKGVCLWIRIENEWCQQLQQLRPMVPCSGPPICPNGLWSSRWIDATMIAISIRRFRVTYRKVPRKTEAVVVASTLAHIGRSQLDDSRAFSL
ncbi:hypothetical protein ABOM_000121 [Aspergillus bombycis]|uniref:Uncharacterized protein n=1 Tax=Aspergillus bombycis TaxID=109264 RepID=A0A1F8AI50_9EURO|nr:hypothetical protein ABOM_000121 [Aspergillus bombycis]OGM51362.1 hypothetical protein ABOM_000121 [Aspergillus bombycis]